MSTRSVIAVPYGDSWRGRYHHSDGYPSGVGRELFKLVNEHGLEWTRKTLTGHIWSFILGADWTVPPQWPLTDPNCGSKGVLCRRCGKERYRYDGKGCQCPQGALTPARCFCHGGRTEKPYWIKRGPVCRQGDLEWAYILGAQALVIEKPSKWNKNYDITGWTTVASIPWNSIEPDWKTVGQLAETA